MSCLRLSLPLDIGACQYRQMSISLEVLSPAGPAACAAFAEPGLLATFGLLPIFPERNGPAAVGG